MGLMRRETLQSIKRASRKMDYHPSTQEIHSLVDHGLAALDELEGGKSVLDHRAELKERERQVKLALADLHAVLAAGTYQGQPVDPKVASLFISDLIAEMIDAKGPKWRREWSWYQPRIQEEFGE